ncbi:MAG: AAA family ATPase [Armatimonadetes bacterium]|nr:AAA family ATPase [Armatimonadota bacterium]
MILHSLTLKNFRQFRGQQGLSFASDTGNGEPNVTVIFGENGRGKTGIFRAVMFALYGERRLSQDGDVPEEELQLVNTGALEASSDKPVSMAVELHFSHRGSRFVVRRSLNALRDGERALEEVDEIFLQETGPDGNTRVVEAGDVDRVIRGVLDPRVREYFLFDGEKIERLTRASVEQRREISWGIRNLLNVDALDGAIGATRQLVRDLEAQATSSTTTELARTLKRLGENESAQEKARQELDELTDEITLANGEKSKVDKELDGIKEIRHILEARRQKEADLEAAQAKASEMLAGMKSQAVQAAGLLVQPVVSRAFEHIDGQKERGQIPSEIRRDLIERLLSEGRCICQRCLREGTEPYKAILDWQARTSEASLQDAALNLWRHLSELCQRAPDESSQVAARLREYSALRGDIAALQEQVAEFGQQVSGSERQDATELEEHRERIEEKLRTLTARSLNLQQQLEGLKTEHEQLEAQLAEEKRKSARTDALARRAILVRDTRDALEAIHGTFTDEIKTELGTLSTDLLGRLLDEDSRANIKRVTVSDDYSLQVLDRYDRPFLANISAGQRQVLSIAFIAALAQAAARDVRLEMPLFMDTPFGRLSAVHRQNLISEIPHLAAQWVLLATDTEFRRQEARWLASEGRWGRFYRLLPAEDGATMIEEAKIADVPALLREEATPR